MSSSDGFCSTLSFAPGELGQPYVPPAVPTASASSSSNNTPLPAATHASSPSLSKSTPNTQSGSVVNNPTPTLGSVPLVTATNSSQPQTLPLTTPPQTPMPGVSHSATSSFSSTVLGKRDIGAASESEKEDANADPKDSKDETKGITELEKPPKKRRIAPTLVSQEEAKET